MNEAHGRRHHAFVPVSEWDDTHRAAYIAEDIEANGIREIDDDPWVVSFLLRVLRGELVLAAADAVAPPLKIVRVDAPPFAFRDETVPAGPATSLNRKATP